MDELMFNIGPKKYDSYHCIDLKRNEQCMIGVALYIHDQSLPVAVKRCSLRSSAHYVSDLRCRDRSTQMLSWDVDIQGRRM